MKPRSLYAALAFAFCLALPIHSQDATQTPAPAKRQPPQPAATQAPGAGPDKVWVNAASKVYHCPGDRYYGRTKDGAYMTEPAAKAAGAHGAHGQTCFK
jgi:hypothetical protein